LQISAEQLRNGKITLPRNAGRTAEEAGLMRYNLLITKYLMSLWTEGALQNWLTVGVLMVVVGGLIAKEAVEERDRESTVYRSIKISFWWLLGVTIGVYFQARLNLKERMKGVIEVVLYGLFIGVTVYTLFTVGDLVKEYF
jgi:hypothetical protein